VVDSIVSILIRLSTLMVVSGWTLSSVSALTPGSYLLVAVIGFGIIAYELRRPGRLRFRFRLHRRIALWWKRRRALPLLYVLVALLVTLGAIIYEPNNFDGLSYRVPKLIFWLHAHRWCWIDSPYVPVNSTLPNYEWLTMPLYLLTRGLHSQVVINLISFLLVPPLFFTLLRALGVSPRMAYDWMWLLPSGYGIALQAGGIGNDLLGLTAILAALYCAIRFTARSSPSCRFPLPGLSSEVLLRPPKRFGRRGLTKEEERGRGEGELPQTIISGPQTASPRPGLLFDAILAAAFCTGIKLSNPPLVGLVAIVLLRDVRQLLLHRRILVGSVAVGLAISALIPLLLNRHYAGTIFGTPPNYAQVTNPAVGWLGNGLILLLSGIEPPLFPSAHHLTALLQKSLGPQVLAWISSHYEKFELKLNELPQEEASSLGLGITAALLVCFVLWLRHRGQSRSPNRTGLLKPWQFTAWWAWLLLSLLVVLAKLGTGQALPRNLLPWFPVLIAALLAVFGTESVVRSRVWKVVAVCAALSVLPALALSPSRPLIPPRLLFGFAERCGVKPSATERMKIVYDVYAQRADPYTELRNTIPVSVKELALVTDGGEPTSSFLKPYGKRICRYLRNGAEVELARADGLDFVIIHEAACETYFGMNAQQWCQTFHAEMIKSSDIRIFAGQPPWRYVLVKLQASPSPSKDGN